MSYFPLVNEALFHFDGMQKLADRNIRTVNAFARTIKYLFYQNDCDTFCQESFFIRYGSNREKTVVSHDADFDLIMVLPQPFTMSNFEALEVEPGVYTLKLRKGLQGFLGECDRYLTRSMPRKLKAQNLRKDIFNNLKYCVSVLESLWTNWNFSCKESLSNFKITLWNEMGRSLIIDVIPQIGVDLQRHSIPGCNLNTFPDVLHSYIETYDYSAFYVLAFPTHLQKSPMKHLLVQINFGLLEFSTIQYSENVRNTIRLCKAISIKTGMKKCGLHHYHIKRMAIALIYSLLDSDPYEGMQIIFQAILGDLRSGPLDGFFIPNQNLYVRDSLPEIEPQRERKCVLEWYELSSNTAQETPPPGWIPEQEERVNPATFLQLNPSPKNSSHLSKVCNESPNKSHFFKGVRVLGICPSELTRRKLPAGTIPSMVFELQCLCEGDKCLAGIATCAAAKQLVTVLITEPDDLRYYKSIVIEITVGCLCVQRMALEGQNKESDALEFKKK